MSRALYAGSFDPFTRGHLDIASKAVRTFDHLEIGVGRNPNKRGFFSVDDRLTLIKRSLEESGDDHILSALLDGRISTASYQGSLVAHARDIGATHVVRGLRQAGDFNDEFAMTGIAGRLDSDVIFTHFICRERFLHVSSSTARELAGVGEDVSWLVTRSVEAALVGGGS